MQIDNFQSDRVHNKQDLSVYYLIVEESLLTHYFQLHSCLHLALFLSTHKVLECCSDFFAGSFYFFHNVYRF